MDCLFCNIVSGKIPTSKVYEDDTVLAFNDIDPKAPVHIVVIPKEHITSMAYIDKSNSGVVAHIFEIIAQLAKEKGLDSGYRVISNCGEQGGQTINHLHFHLMGGRDFRWPAG